MKLFLFANALSFLLLYVDGNVAQEKCSDTKLSKVSLDEAIRMLQKVKDSYPAENLLRQRDPTDCYDLLKMGHRRSGVYSIWPQNRIMGGGSVRVYCDMHTDGGGWTVIQRRGDFQRPFDYFYKNWKEYKRGFGYLDEDFWLGNDYIFAISNQKEYTARFDMKSLNNEGRHAHYGFFWIDNEDRKYTLHIGDYNGDAGDSMSRVHNGMMFSTKDNDNSIRPTGCANSYKAGWWYNDCYEANLNGLYSTSPNPGFEYGDSWMTFRGLKECLKEVEIKIRPKVYQKIENDREPELQSESDTVPPPAPPSSPPEADASKIEVLTSN